MNRIIYTHNNWLAHKINNESFKRHMYLIKGRVVDLGCGTAPYKDDILNIANEYIGVDWEKSVHDLSKLDIAADLREKLPIEGEYADTVVSFQVMEHLPQPGFFLSECYRILKKGGWLLLTVPFLWHVHEAPHDYFRYTRYGIEYMLKENGFIDVTVEENTGFWQMWILEFNYHTGRLAKGLMQCLWIPVWWLGQVLAPRLDSVRTNKNMCASYTVSATKA
jgi:SAM-dependent methyltransferase